MMIILKTNNIYKYFRFLLLLAALISAAGCSERKSEPVINFEEELHNVARLELGRMTVSKVGTITDPKPAQASGLLGKAEAMVNSVKIGTRLGVYTYDTYLVAYIDLSRLQPGDITVDEELKKVYVSLPPVEIMPDGRDVTLHEVHSRVSGLRSQITPAERARLKSRMAAEVKREMEADVAGKKQLKERAEAKAKGWITGFIRNRGYDAEVVILD